MAYTKTNWVNGQTPINATNLNKIENGIAENYTAIGTLSNLNTTNKSSLVSAINEINSNDIAKGTYSTNETIIGEWMNNKPLYRKVLSTVGLTGSTKKSIAYNIENLDKIWIENGFAENTVRIVTLPMVGYDGDLSQEVDVWVEKQENAVKLYSNGGWGADWSFYIILNYTKTTD